MRESVFGIYTGRWGVVFVNMQVLVRCDAISRVFLCWGGEVWWKRMPCVISTEYLTAYFVLHGRI